MRDFEDDTALYAITKAEFYRLRGAGDKVRLYSDSARQGLEVELRENQVLPWRRVFWGTPTRGSAARRTRSARASPESGWRRTR